MSLDAPWIAAAGWGLAASCALAVATWLVSLPLRDVSIVDVAWGLLVLSAAGVATFAASQAGPRAVAVLALTAAWALRLAFHIARRSRGRPEDARYAAIRARNEPHFAVKSLWLMFALQAVLAWIVALPVMAAATSPVPWQALDAAGMALALFGACYEAIADLQLARFRSDPSHEGKVMDQGLWRYSRHPNYFGECCVWWGLWLVALSAGAWWTVVSPVLMTVLLLRVSGVTLLESTIGDRRPAYADYVRRTNAFVPGSPHA